MTVPVFDDNIIRLALDAGDLESLHQDWFIDELRHGRITAAQRFLTVALSSPLSHETTTTSDRPLADFLPIIVHDLIEAGGVDAWALQAGLKLLLDAGISFSEFNGEQQDTPVTCAARAGSIAALRYLILHLPDAQLKAATFQSAQTLIHAAACSESRSCLELAYETGKALGIAEALTSLGESPLHLAVEANRVDAAKFLIDKGYEVNEVPMRLPTGSLPLMTAISEDNDDMVEMLLANGADPWKRDGAGTCAFDMPDFVRFEPLLKIKRQRDRDAVAKTADSATTTRHRRVRRI